MTFRRASVATQLTLSTVVLAVLTTIVILTVTTLQAVAMARTTGERYLETIRESIIPSLAKGVWTSDETQVRLLTRGLLAFETIQAAAVVKGHTILAHAGNLKKLDSARFIQSEVPLTVTRGKIVQRVAVLKIAQGCPWEITVSSPALWTELVFQAIQVIAIVLAVYLLALRIVARPLVTLSLDLDRTDPAHPVPEALRRSMLIRDSRNELDLVRRAVGGSLLRIGEEMNRREHTEQILSDSLAEKEVLLREVHHRVKNNLQIVISMLSLQKSTITDHETAGLITESQKRIHSMALVHELIYRSDTLRVINLVDYLRELQHNIVDGGKEAHIARSIVCAGEEPCVGLDSAIACGLIVTELMTNSAKHTFPPGQRGEIVIEISNTDGDVIAISVRDNGTGCPEFETTETVRRGEMLGLQIIDSLCEQLGAETSFVNGNPGCRFTFSFTPSDADSGPTNEDE